MRIKNIVLLLRIVSYYKIIATNFVSPIALTGTSIIIIDHKLIERLDVTLVAHKGIQKLNGTLKHRVNMPALEAEVQVQIQQLRNIWTRFIDMKFDICKFLNGEYKNNQVLRSIRKRFLKSRSLRQKCPVPARHVYVLDLFDVSTSYPNYLPNVALFATVNVYTKSHLLWQFNLTGFTKAVIRMSKNAE